jgi:ribosome-associated toxin RatA of RatAB toxin-antitoxin module
MTQGASLDAVRLILVCGGLLLCASAPQAQESWTSEPAVQARLAAGEVVVSAPREVDASHPRGEVRAAVVIKADADAVWRVMTDCAQALKFVPGLRKCRVVQAAPDGTWADIEQEVRYSWLLPTVHYVFRAQYDRPHRIDFHRISGDLKEQRGTWVLTAAPATGATLVEYEVYLEPGFWVPQFLVTRSLRKDLPAALTGLREHVQRAGTLASGALLPASAQ